MAIPIERGEELREMGRKLMAFGYIPFKDDRGRTCGWCFIGETHLRPMKAIEAIKDLDGKMQLLFADGWEAGQIPETGEAFWYRADDQDGIFSFTEALMATYRSMGAMK